jgi:hypothetical protein
VHAAPSHPGDATPQRGFQMGSADMTSLPMRSTKQGHDRALCVVPALPQVDLTAVIGASTGLFGATWAQAELRKILQTIGAKVVERDLALAQAHH